MLTPFRFVLWLQHLAKSGELQDAVVLHEHTHVPSHQHNKKRGYLTRCFMEGVLRSRGNQDLRWQFHCKELKELSQRRTNSFRAHFVEGSPQSSSASYEMITGSTGCCISSSTRDSVEVASAGLFRPGDEGIGPPTCEPFDLRPLHLPGFDHRP